MAGLLLKQWSGFVVCFARASHHRAASAVTPELRRHRDSQRTNDAVQCLRKPATRGHTPT
jgi:hypothetical protein